ncbi:MAG: hypothetical protein NUV50_13275 [Rhodospirillales bacterium]|nr:hypothetical protein [Rhodospirillales bacterium]
MSLGYRKIAAIIFTGAWFVGLAVSTPHAQEPYNPDKVSQVINIFDAIVNYPSPSWQRSINIQNEHEFYRNQSGAQFIFEMIPKGEAFEAWSKMLVISGARLPDGTNMDLGLFANSQIAPFAQICARESFSVQTLQASTDAVSVIVYCPDSPNGPKALGYGAGVGEIALIAFRKANRTFIKIAHEWRGPRFVGENQKTWPVDLKVLTNMVNRFKKITVTPKL